MAVTAGTYSSDAIGAQLDAAIAAQQTVVNGLSPKTQSQLYQIAFQALTNLQITAVLHYLATGRINPATILSSLS